MNSFFPLCVGTTYIHLCLCWTCEDRWYWTTNTEPIDNWLNKHHGKKDILGSVQQWSTSPRLIQTACSIQPQTCTFHSMSCTWPNCSTPDYVKQLQRRKPDLSCLWTAKDGSSIHFSLNQRGPVRFFYCSTKGFNAYSDEGLTNCSVL